MPLLLVACGFTPIAAPGSEASRLAGTIALPPATNAFEFALRERLALRLRPGETQRFVLDVQSAVVSEERAIRGDNTISRFSLTGTATYTVTSLTAPAPVTSGTVRATTAYSAVGSPFATRSAEDDARRRLAEDLAERIVLRLTATADSWAP